MVGMKKKVFSPNLNLESNSLDSSLGIRIVTSLMIIFTLVGAFWAGFFPIRFCNDSWWHIKTGQVLWEYFQEHGFSFPPYDVFTNTGANTPWVNHEWLADLIFYGAYAVGGLQGAIALKSMVITLTSALLVLYMVRNGVSWKMACLGALLVLLASQNSLDLRPPIFTYLFIVIFLHIILCFQLDEYFNWAFAGAIAAEILWINLHGGAVIGIILLFFWWLSELWFCIVTWLRENPTDPSFKRLGASTVVLVSVALASLINPFTYQIHLLPMKVMNDPWLVSRIGELASPNMHFTREFELIILGLFLLPMLRAGSVWIYEGLAIVFFGHHALNYVRQIPLFALVAVPPLMSALAEERRALIPLDYEDDEYTGFWGSLCKLLKWMLNRHVDVVLAFLLVAYGFGLRPGKIWERNYQDFEQLREEGYRKDKYPVDAVNFIELYKIPGPMFNHDNFSGYLIWRLSPEKYKIFTDARYDLWGSQFAKEELAAIAARDIPLGVYDAKGRWWDFPDLVKTKDDIQYYAELARIPDLESLQDWFQSGKPYWQYLLDDKYKINYIILYDIDPLQYYLQKQFQGWFLVFHEKGYVILLRDDPKNDAILKKFAKNFRDKLRLIDAPAQ